MADLTHAPKGLRSLRGVVVGGVIRCPVGPGGATMDSELAIPAFGLIVLVALTLTLVVLAFLHATRP